MKLRLLLFTFWKILSFFDLKNNVLGKETIWEIKFWKLHWNRILAKGFTYNRFLFFVLLTHYLSRKHETCTFESKCGWIDFCSVRSHQEKQTNKITSHTNFSWKNCQFFSISQENYANVLFGHQEEHSDVLPNSEVFFSKEGNVKN